MVAVAVLIALTSLVRKLVRGGVDPLGGADMLHVGLPWDVMILGFSVVQLLWGMVLRVVQLPRGVAPLGGAGMLRVGLPQGVLILGFPVVQLLCGVVLRVVRLLGGVQLLWVLVVLLLLDVVSLRVGTLVGEGGVRTHPGSLAPGSLAPGSLAPGSLAPGSLAPGSLGLGLRGAGSLDLGSLGMGSLGLASLGVLQPIFIVYPAGVLHEKRAMLPLVVL